MTVDHTRWFLSTGTELQSNFTLNHKSFNISVTSTNIKDINYYLIFKLNINDIIAHQQRNDQWNVGLCLISESMK